MSHHVYTTRGLVLGLQPFKEADIAASVLTRDLGLVVGSARGARKLASKLTSSLLGLSLAKVSLVRGKNAWRITTVTLLRDVATELRERRLSLGAVYRVSALASRLIRGEEKHPELYDDLERAVLLLLDETEEEDADAWELFAVARLLFRLGYLSEVALPANVVETRSKRRELIDIVNAGIRESGLYNV